MDMNIHNSLSGELKVLNHFITVKDVSHVMMLRSLSSLYINTPLRFYHSLSYVHQTVFSSVLFVCFFNIKQECFKV